jgi:hypothetical protein
MFDSWRHCILSIRSRGVLGRDARLRLQVHHQGWRQRHSLGKHNNSRFLLIASDIVVYHGWFFQAQTDPVMGAGISIAFNVMYTGRSLCGFGQFPHLKILINWAVQVNLLLIQLGPVQDANFSFGPEEVTPDR